jgi:hypothetical protein
MKWRVFLLEQSCDGLAPLALLGGAQISCDRLRGLVNVHVICMRSSSGGHRVGDGLKVQNVSSRLIVVLWMNSGSYLGTLSCD